MTWPLPYSRLLARDTAEWTPASRSDLYLWYHARDASGYTLSGSAVATLQDRSGNGRHAVAADTVTTPATIVSAGTDFWGPAFHLAGFPNSFTATGVEWPSEGTVCAVVRAKEVAARDICGSTDGFNTYSVGVKFRSGPSEIWLDVIPDSTVNRTLIMPTAPTYAVDDRVIVIGRWSSASGVVFDRRVNGGPWYQDSGAYRNPNGVPPAETAITIGAVDGAGNGALDHVMAEFIVFSSHLPDGPVLGDLKTYLTRIAGV